MGRTSQRKGRKGELELCNILQRYGYPVQTGQALNYGTQPDLTGLDGIHIECKRAEQMRISDWMKQAAADAEKFKDGAPCIFHRRSREEWLVTLRLSDFMNIYTNTRKGENQND